jgi:DNA-binding NtrC family response regulator
VAALAEAGGQKPRAADLLQVSYKTLLQKLKELKIEG